MVESVIGVDPDSAGTESVGDVDGSVEVRGVDGGGEAVCGAVADLDGVLFRLELGDRADRAEDLLLHDLHVLADIGEDGRLDEVALVAMALTANLNLGTGLLTLVDVTIMVSGNRKLENILRHIPHNAVEL